MLSLKPNIRLRFRGGANGFKIFIFEMYAFDPEIHCTRCVGQRVWWIDDRLRYAAGC
jgi:hypothetical protein